LTSKIFLSIWALSASLISELGNPHGVLRTTAERRGPAVALYAGGEVDAANEQTWRWLLAEASAAASAPGPFVIDIDGLDFMGCCAFFALAQEAERCNRRGIAVALISRKPTVARVVAATGLGARLSIYPDTDTALSALVAAAHQ
jgi:anti-anti-sigma factor